MDLLIDVHSGETDTLIPNLVMASMLKAQGVDVSCSERDKVLVAFVEKDFKYSSPVAKYAAVIEKNAKKMGLPIDPMTLLKSSEGSRNTCICLRGGGRPIWY